MTENANSSSSASRGRETAKKKKTSLSLSGSAAFSRKKAPTLRPLGGGKTSKRTTASVPSPGEKKKIFYSALCSLMMTWQLMELTGHRGDTVLVRWRRKRRRCIGSHMGRWRTYTSLISCSDVLMLPVSKCEMSSRSKSTASLGIGEPNGPESSFTDWITWQPNIKEASNNPPYPTRVGATVFISELSQFQVKLWRPDWKCRCVMINQFQWCSMGH